MKKTENLFQKRHNNPYIKLLAGYTRSIFQDFESFLRSEVNLVEGDIRMVFDEYISGFITYEKLAGFYTLKDLSEVFLRNFQLQFDGVDKTIEPDFDYISRKTETFVRPGILAIGFDEKSFSHSILGFNPHWDYKHYDEYIGQKIVKLSTIDEIQLNCDIYDGRVVNGLSQTKCYQFRFR